MQEILEHSPTSFSKHVIILDNGAQHCLEFIKSKIPLEKSSNNWNHWPYWKSNLKYQFN